MPKKQPLETTLRNFFNTNALKKTFHYGSRIVNVVYPALENPNWLSGTKAVVELGKIFAEEARASVDGFFDAGWITPYGYEFNTIISKALTQRKQAVLKSSQEGQFIRIVNLGGARVGWTHDAKHNVVDCIFVEETTADVAIQKIRELLWQKYKDKSIVLHKKTNRENLTEDVCFDVDDSMSPLPSEIADKTCVHLKKFLNAGMSRSIMIYGPPGTGKSTMTRAIVDGLNMRSFRIRVEDLKDLDNSILTESINIFKPDAIILDDFDRVSQQESLLETLEFFQRNVKLIIATVNDRSRLDRALLRPGRFDEFIHVTKMDDKIVKHMLGEFSDAYEIVKDWPIAYIEEYVKRRKFMSSEETMDSIKELTSRIQLLNSCDSNDDELKLPTFKGKRKK